MTFIGIISDKKSFDTLKEKLYVKNIKMIHINKKIIENIKNIKFETIIINKNIKYFEEKTTILENLCNSANYLIINTDIKINLNLNKNNNKTNIITYGLNQKATVTVSSITENRVLIDLQRNIKNKNGDIIEVFEKHVNPADLGNIKTYEILIIFIVLCIYN